MDVRGRTLDAIATLREIFGVIPRDLQRDFVLAGARLPVSAFEPRVRVPRAPPAVRAPCTGKTAKGAACKNKACHGHEMCMIHYRQSQRMVADVETVMYCTRDTSKGARCKCKTFRGLDACWRHAKKEGLLPDVPSDCAICMNEMAPSERTKTKCGHYFHTACLGEWARRRGTTGGTARRRTVKAPCPMCRAPFTLPGPPPMPLEGPAWYVMGNVAPTLSTPEAEWVERLNVIPMNPMMTPETLRHYAGYAGRMMLNYVTDHNGEFPSDALMRTILRMHHITQR